MGRSLLTSRLGLILDRLHDNTASDRYGVIAQGEAVSGAVGPGCADRRPDGLFALTCNTIDALSLPVWRKAVSSEVRF